MNNSRLRKVGSRILALLLLFYVGYQIFKANYSSIRTENVSYFTASRTVKVSVVALRNEVLLTSPAGGAVDFAINSGSRVAKGGTIAEIYANSEQISVKHQLADIDREIQQLQNLQQSASAYSLSAETANERICMKLSEMLNYVSSGELPKVYSEKSSLLNLLSEKEIGTGKVKDFKSRISELQSQRKTIAAKAGKPTGTIVSPVSGYFIDSTDGMESAYDISKISTITCSDIQKLQTMKAVPVSGSIGKIDRDFNWYLVCIVPADELVPFRHQMDTGGSLSIQFPFVSNMSISATLETINMNSDNSAGAVVLQCKEINSELAGIRRETANISFGEYTGLRVSQKAVHYANVKSTTKDANGKKTTVEKKVMGVYVLHGNQIVFRQIVPEFSTESYVICKANPNDDEILTSDTVRYNDEVVVEGTNLYDGKVIK
ncbi:MAG: Secretion protein HlyD [Thermocaproicibacter melissae]|uniref:HlyD family efflux transporter periplasmic adaptor subunit n=1 Tax=Thermocaproicibacter melissae TaxID=2966552 RepID=UPI003A1035F1